MNEILKLMNELRADELDSLIMRASIMLEKKRQEEAEEALREKERQRQEKIAQEKKRQEEIAELQRKLKELQAQRIDVSEKQDEVKGNGFVMYDSRRPIDDAFAAKAAAEPTAQPAPEKPAPEKPKAPEMIVCPHCQLMNVATSKYCANCGQKMASRAKIDSKPVQSASAKVSCPHCHQMNDTGSVYCANCGQKISAPQPQQTAPSKQTPPQPVTPRSQATSTAAVRYADESMSKWTMLPGEQNERGKHEIALIQPDGGKFAYYMEVTNKRILFTRESSGAKNVALAARMGGGLVGSLIAEGIKSAAGAGPKPWLEIPLTAISDCGIQNKKEFFIVADQTYVLKNKGYEKFLPALIMNAKRGGN